VLALAWALYLETRARGHDYYKASELETGYETGYSAPESPLVSEVVKELERRGFATHYAKRAESGHAHIASKTEYYLKITPFGLSIIGRARKQAIENKSELFGLVESDIHGILADDKRVDTLRVEINRFKESEGVTKLSNFERALLKSYLDILLALCNSPEPDAPLFWTVLNRISLIAGIGSFVAALVALKVVG